MALQFEARKVALKQDKTGFILTLSLHPDEIPVELMRDFVGARYACAVVRIEDDELPAIYNNRVQRAGMLCRDIQFQAFMAEKVGDELDEDKTATALCNACGIESRSALNGNKEAQIIFDKLVDDFNIWNKDSLPF